MSTSARWVLPALVLAGGCDNSWRTDMWYQPSLRPEEGPRPQPEHSVPQGAPPSYESRDDTEDLKNPVAPDAAALARAKEIFLARCLPCHGRDGHGGGPVSKLFPPAPDLAYATVRARSDGYLFGTITFGGRAMPSQAEGLTQRDRWDLVDLIREIQATTDAGAPGDGGSAGAAPGPMGLGPPAEAETPRDAGAGAGLGLPGDGGSFGSAADAGRRSP